MTPAAPFSLGTPPAPPVDPRPSSFNGIMFVRGATVAATGSTPTESGNSSQPTVATSAPATTADGITSDSTGSNKYDSGDRVAGSQRYWYY